MENINIIDKNWKALIKPSKLAITSNDDKWQTIIYYFVI